jgi:hypothetical protein
MERDAAAAASPAERAGAMPPQPTRQWTIISETGGADSVRFHVRYADDASQLERETTWKCPPRRPGRDRPNASQQRS